MLPLAWVLGGLGRLTWLAEMPRRRRLTFGFTMPDDGLIAAMAALPWWRQLTFLEAKFVGLERTVGLGALWKDRWWRSSGFAIRGRRTLRVYWVARLRS